VPSAARAGASESKTQHLTPPVCSDLTPRHRKLAEITEMIHTASLVHDDVLDDCDLRRGA
jgi:geranylgeranyl pyrophosphate synthase